MKRRWPRVCGTLIFIVIIIIVTQLHVIISAPTSAARAPADDVTDHVTTSWQLGSDVTETRQTVSSNGDGVLGNASASASRVRHRRHQLSSQGCGPVCNRCRQVRTKSAPCTDWGSGMSGGYIGIYTRVQLFAIEGNGWPHNAPRYH